MMNSHSITVGQTCPIKGDVEVNINEHLRLARMAAAEGAQIIVFPELSLTGYELSIARELAFSENDPRLHPLIEAAANPFERPDLFLSRSTIERRIEQLTARLSLNRERVVAWAFARAVLSVIWQIEDGFVIDASNISLKLATAVSRMMTVPEALD